MEDSKWQRISALRPAGVRAAIGPDARNGTRLLELLDGERRSNALGEYVVVRRRFDEPLRPATGSDALRLIAPGLTGDLLNPQQWLFLDTETTGLAGGTGTYAFLIGVARWEDSGFVVEQFFMRDHADEPSMLAGLACRLAEHPVLVTFNGKSFDWPLLETRFRMTRAAKLAAPALHLDLLYPSRQLWRLSLKSLALCELERHVLGFHRDRDIPAETIPRRYFEFLHTGVAEPVADVFHHNRLDLCGLAALAANIIRILENPHNGQCGAGELFGISRMLQRTGDTASAGLLFEQALAGGLPDDAERVARRELAGIARRMRDFERANTFWEQLLGDSSDGLDAYEQLAIHYEHRARQFDRAVSLTREALVRLQEAFRAGRIPPQAYRSRHAALQHRLSRLKARLSQGTL